MANFKPKGRVPQCCEWEVLPFPEACVVELATGGQRHLRQRCNGERGTGNERVGTQSHDADIGEVVPVVRLSSKCRGHVKKSRGADSSVWPWAQPAPRLLKRQGHRALSHVFDGGDSPTRRSVSTIGHADGSGGTSPADQGTTGRTLELLLGYADRGGTTRRFSRGPITSRRKIRCRKDAVAGAQPGTIAYLCSRRRDNG